MAGEVQADSGDGDLLCGIINGNGSGNGNGNFNHGENRKNRRGAIQPGSEFEPTPAEIRAMCLLIQEEWSPRIERTRRGIEEGNRERWYPPGTLRTPAMEGEIY